MKKYILILMLTISSISNTVIAQEATDNKSKSPSKWTLRADLFKHTPLVAFANASQNGFHYPSDFGFTVGAERNIRTRPKSRMYQYGIVGFYNQVYFERVGTLATGLGLHRKLYKTFGTNFETDIAYNRAVSSHLMSVIENGNWVSKVDKSTITNRFAFSLGGNFEYDFTKRKKLNLPLAITLGYNATIVTPYLPKEDIPLSVNHQPRIGLKWKL